MSKKTFMLTRQKGGLESISLGRWKKFNINLYVMILVYSVKLKYDKIRSQINHCCKITSNLFYQDLNIYDDLYFSHFFFEAPSFLFL